MLDVERLQRRPAGQHQQLVGIDTPVIRQQDAYRHVEAIITQMLGRVNCLKRSPTNYSEIE